MAAHHKLSGGGGEGSDRRPGGWDAVPGIAIVRACIWVGRVEVERCVTGGGDVDGDCAELNAAAPRQAAAAGGYCGVGPQEPVPEVGLTPPNP